MILPKEIAKLVPKDKLMPEHVWRKIGVQQSQGWVHYMVHKPGINKACGLIKAWLKAQSRGFKH